MTQTIDTVTVNATVDRDEVYRKVDRGVQIHRTLEELHKELAEVKAFLREAAASGAFPATETGTVEIRSPETENCAQVVACKDTPTLIAGKDLTALKANLTAGEFDLMFREVVILQSAAEFEVAFNAATKKVQAFVRRFVAWRPNTAQVRFSK